MSRSDAWMMDESETRNVPFLESTEYIWRDFLIIFEEFSEYFYRISWLYERNLPQMVVKNWPEIIHVKVKRVKVKHFKVNIWMIDETMKRNWKSFFWIYEIVLETFFWISFENFLNIFEGFSEYFWRIMRLYEMNCPKLFILPVVVVWWPAYVLWTHDVRPVPARRTRILAPWQDAGCAASDCITVNNGQSRDQSANRKIEFKILFFLEKLKILKMNWFF